MKWNKIWVAFVAGGMSLGFMAAAVGDTIALQNNNSAVTIDPTSQAGVNSWTVNGVNQLTQEWFWFRLNNDSTASSLDRLSLSDSGSYHGTRGYYLDYTNSSTLSVGIDYLLTGGGTVGKESNLTETISISNISASPETIHFYAYSNFDLNGASDDTVTFPNANTTLQTNGVLYQAQTVANPTPNEFESDYVNGPNAMLPRLKGPGPVTLLNTPAIGPAGIGPGNMTSTYEWDMTIAAGDTNIISLDKQLNVVPEPSTFALLGAGATALLACAWRRRRYTAGG